jgi:phasin family protein
MAKTSSKKRTAKHTASAQTTSAKSKKTNNITAFKPTNSFIKMEKTMTPGKAQFDKFTNEATSAGREGFEAFNRSMAVFAKGCEDFMRASISIAQSSAEKQAQLAKEAMSSKSLNEWADVQNRIAQSNFDDAMAAATTLSEIGVRILSESTAPLNNQFSKNLKRASDSAAA